MKESLWNKIVVVGLLLLAIADLLVGLWKKDTFMLLQAIFFLLLANTNILVHK